MSDNKTSPRDDGPGLLDWLSQILLPAPQPVPVPVPVRKRPDSRR